MPGQAANGENLGTFSSIFYKMIVCCMYSLESLHINNTIRNYS